MNEKIDLTKILKDCPKGFELYSTVLGYVFFKRIDDCAIYPIVVSCKNGNVENFTNDGKIIIDYDGECTLFPSKDQRDWNKFSAPWYKEQRFDPKTLKPFDRVLVKDYYNNEWFCDILSHIKQECPLPYVCIGSEWECCIPYNDDTKHLVGTTDAAPEFYRYWED